MSKGGVYFPTVIVSNEHLEQLGIRFKRCRHCGGQAEARCRRQKPTPSNPSPMLGWVICLSCSMQTGKYTVTADSRTFHFLAKIWNRTMREGGFESVIQKGSHYGDGEGN